MKHSKIKIKPSGNKSRFGYRGNKRRYSVFKAEWNKKYAPIEEAKCRDICEPLGLDAEAFVSEDDNPNRKWSYALIRLKRLLQHPNWPNRYGRKRNISPFYRY